MLRTVLFAYDQEEHIRMEKEESRERGREEGRREGSAETLARVNKLNMNLLANNRIGDLQRALQDPEYQKKLFQEFKI